MARPASDIRPRILEAARGRFLVQGVDGAALRAIANDAGTSIGMVYYYFKSKDELFLAVVDDAYQALLGDFEQALRADVPPEQRLARLYHRVARMDDREFQVVRLIMREALISSSRLTRIAERFQQGHIPLVLATVAEGVATGRNDPQLHPAVLVAATASLGLLPQILHRLISATALPAASLLPDREAAADALAGVLLSGIGGPALKAGRAKKRAR
jgi:AcrR family transcriptional regulator